MLWAKFNSNGQYIGQANVGSEPFAGTDNFQIFAVFDGVNLSNYGSASIKFYKPDLNQSSVISLPMIKKVTPNQIKFEGATNDYFTNNEYYSGFYFDFQDYVTDGTEEILDTAGLWRAVITLMSVRDLSLRNVVGSVTFSVGNGNESEESHDASIEQLLTQIYARVGSKLDIISPDYVKTVETIEGAVFEDAYNVGDIIVDRSTLLVYQLNTNKEPVLFIGDVVELNGESGILTEAQVTLLKRTNTRIHLVGSVVGGTRSDLWFYRDRELTAYDNLDNVTYREIPSIYRDSQKWVASSKKIVVAFSNGAWTLTDEANGLNIATEEFVENRVVYIEPGETSGTFNSDEINALLNYNAIIIQKGSPFATDIHYEDVYIKERVTVQSNRVAGMSFRRIAIQSGTSGGVIRKGGASIYVVVSSGNWSLYTGEYAFYTNTKVDELLDLKADKVDTFTKLEVTELVNQKTSRQNLVSVIGEASQSVNGLMSIEDKRRLDALYALLGEEEDPDAIVDTISEILEIFQNYPEGFNIAQALAEKVNISSIADNLTTDSGVVPLSARQGMILNQKYEWLKAAIFSGAYMDGELIVLSPLEYMDDDTIMLTDYSLVDISTDIMDLGDTIPDNFE